MINNVIIVADKSNIDFKSFNKNTTFFIGVERGSLDLISKNIEIDLSIADFDKVTKKELDLIKIHSKKMEIHNADKFYLDGELAIIEAKKLNVNNISFIANPNKRYDKNLSIFGLVFKYDIRLINDNSIIMLLKKGENIIKFDQYQDMTYVSFFSKEKTNITIKNMVYNTNSLLLEAFDNSCISNEFIPYTDPIIICDKDIVCVMTK